MGWTMSHKNFGGMLLQIPEIIVASPTPPSSRRRGGIHTGDLSGQYMPWIELKSIGRYVRVKPFGKDRISFRSRRPRDRWKRRRARSLLRRKVPLIAGTTFAHQHIARSCGTDWITSPPLPPTPPHPRGGPSRWISRRQV